MIFFYPRINIPKIHNKIIDISSFQTGLNVLFSLNSFYFKSKVIEGSHKGENVFLILSTSFQNVHFWGCDIFFLPSGCPVNSILQWQYIFIRSTFLMKHFSSYCQNAYDHQSLQGGDILRGALTHKYAWHLNGVVFLGHVTNKIHISTCRRCIDTTLGKVLTKCKRLPNITLRSNDQR